MKRKQLTLKNNKIILLSRSVVQYNIKNMYNQIEVGVFKHASIVRK